MGFQQTATHVQYGIPVRYTMGFQQDTPWDSSKIHHGIPARYTMGFQQTAFQVHHGFQLTITNVHTLRFQQTVFHVVSMFYEIPAGSQLGIIHTPWVPAVSQLRRGVLPANS
jgi:hypothetical protein